ncbi:hypothetical protein E0W69_016825 [Rhizosphaericola mali]|uniref:Uncharacterized protein n=2 Tax=Rhizosphaericola mali TaxID=2545455 RepID=A0A5P2GAM9_9BACT|nr:hypothetical protein E0W69_016825 [Rhizosphaericola mali]
MRFLFRLGWIQILLLHCNCHNSNNNVQNESDTTLCEIESNLHEKFLDVVNYGIIIHGDTSIVNYKTIAPKENLSHIKNIMWNINKPIGLVANNSAVIGMDKPINNGIESKISQLNYNDFFQDITFLTRKIATKQSFDSLQYIDVNLALINGLYAELDSIYQKKFNRKLSELNHSEKIKSIILSSTFVSDINRLFSTYQRKVTQSGEAKLIIFLKNGTPQIGGTLGLVIGKRS